MHITTEVLQIYKHNKYKTYNYTLSESLAHNHEPRAKTLGSKLGIQVYSN